MTRDNTLVSPLCEKLRDMGTELEITGKTPFFLDDPKTVWWVLKGQLDVYVTARKGNEQAGGRDFLFTVDAGGALFGVAAGFFGDSMGLLASGIPGTRVLRVALADLLELARGDMIDEVARLIDGFLEGLGRGMVKDIVPKPRIRRKLIPGTNRIEADQILGTDELVWARLEAGNMLFTGTEDLVPGQGLFAVPTSCWLVPLEDSTIEARTTINLLDSGTLPTSLDGFCGTIFSILAMNARLQAADDLGALRQTQKAGRNALAIAMRALSSTLSMGTTPKRISGVGTPLLRACAAVADSLGMTMVPPTDGASNTSLSDLARAANLRVRPVTLAGDWMRRDGASMIAYREGSPVALIPTGRGGYRIVDDKGSGPVTSEVGASLESEAFHLYRPLPARPLKGWDLLRFGLRGSKRDLEFTFVMAICLALLGLISPAVNGIVFSEVIPEAERGRMLQLFAILISVALSSGLLRFAQGIAFLRAETVLDHDVSAGIWDRILRLPVAFFRQTTSGDLGNRALGLFMLRNVASMTVKTLLVQSVFVVFFLGQSLWYDWKMGLAGLGGLIFLGGVMLTVNVFQLTFQRRMTSLQNRLSGLTFQILSGIAKIRVAGAEERSFARWADLFSRQRQLGTSARRLENRLNTVVALFPLAISMLLLFALVHWSAENGQYDTGNFMAFWSAFGCLQGAFLMVVSSLTTTLNVLPLAENLSPILETQPETGELKSDPGRIVGRIDLDRVTFRYRKDGPPVLSDLSLHAEPGEFVAVVGPSGAGKSTLIRILLGFDLPESGSVFYDNNDLAELDLKKLRGQIGVVLQGGGLLPGDIASNIRCSRPLSTEDVETALTLAGMKDDLAAMPMGVNTIISEGANTISGGQRQRLLIARSIAGKPPVLIFDEATSALDNRTQAKISQSLEGIEATRIVVAHRLSTIKGADRIFVLDKGRLVEEGSYEELLARNGLFTELVRRQIV